MATLKSLATKCKLLVRFGANLPYEKQDEWQRKANGYRCTLRYKRRAYSFDYWKGVGCTEEPTAEKCLDCLLSDCSALDQSFENWCREFGYDTDSRKAERIYHACQESGKGMRRLLGTEFDIFMDAER